jgi:hypothetical protein
MQVSKWLGHSSFVLTLSTYADYIREEDLATRESARLPERRVDVHMWTRCGRERPVGEWSGSPSDTGSRLTSTFAWCPHQGSNLGPAD